jgi:hypothetical protein
MLLLTRNKNDERETALLGVLWVLSVHFHKQRDPPLAKKKKEEKEKRRPDGAFSHIFRWLLVIYLPTQKELEWVCNTHFHFCCMYNVMY